jgi:hypothetical protein
MERLSKSSSSSSSSSKPTSSSSSGEATDRKSYWLGLLFITSTAIQVYLGLKCISFDFKNEGKEGPLMGKVRVRVK